MKPLKCMNCKHFDENQIYKGEGDCKIDGAYTREHRVCNHLDTEQKIRDAITKGKT